LGGLGGKGCMRRGSGGALGSSGNEGVFVLNVE
jgi:hypothetical protein